MTSLVSFKGTNGSNPIGGLVFDAVGNLYGTTQNGGGLGDGTFFEIAAGSRAFSTLVSFNVNNGQTPTGGLIIDSSNNIYGTTSAGSYNGSVFEWSVPTKTFSSIATFSSPTGFEVLAGVTEDAAGNLYGACYMSGGNSSGGTLFELAAGTHAHSTLVNFTYYQGQNPGSDLRSDTAGNLYGTTNGGGNNGGGTLYELTTTPSHTVTAIASFSSTTGGNPSSPVETANGNFIGSAFEGGANNDGTIYEFSPSTGNLTALASFNGSNGRGPNGDLIADANGNLYGVTDNGGLYGDGTVFEFNPLTNAITTLYSFNGTDGDEPYADLIPDAAGNLYGVTRTSGASGDGNVYELSGTGFAVASVPEPANIPLLAAAVIVVRCSRRMPRRRQTVMI